MRRMYSENQLKEVVNKGVQENINNNKEKKFEFDFELESADNTFDIPNEVYEKMQNHILFYVFVYNNTKDDIQVVGLVTFKNNLPCYNAIEGGFYLSLIQNNNAKFESESIFGANESYSVLIQPII